MDFTTLLPVSVDHAVLTQIGLILAIVFRTVKRRPVSS